MGCSLNQALAVPARQKVSVNGVVIPHAVISREVQNHPARSPAAAWTEAARALVVRELLLQEARRRSVVARPAVGPGGLRESDEEALIRALVEQELGSHQADETMCRRYYDDNLHRFRAPDLFEAAHILIAARRDQAEAFSASRNKAELLSSILAREPGRFAELAAEHSDCASAGAGGNLGQLSTGDATPEFERILRALQPGEITATPVEARYGFHIIRLDRHLRGRELPFEHVRERIAAYRAAGIDTIGLNPAPPDVYFPLYEGHFPDGTAFPEFSFPAYLEVFEETFSFLGG